MNELDSLTGATPADLTLDDVVGSPTDTPKTLPEASVRNRAAVVSLLTNDTETIPNYQVMLAEGKAGSDATVVKLSTAIANREGKLDMATMINTLGDRNVPIETKKELIRRFAKNDYLSDVNAVLRARTLEAPSKDETIDSERARISTADAIKEMQDEAEVRQGVVNRFAASRDSSTASGLADLAAVALVPFGTNIITGKVANEQDGGKGLWNTLKRGVFTGETLNNMREQFENMPPAQRTEYVKKLADSLSKQGGIIFPGSNHYAQVEILRAITEDGRYNNFDRFIDDASTLLDVVGLGGMARSFKGARTAVKAADSGVPSKESIKAAVGASKPVQKPGTALTEIIHKADWELVDEPVKAAAAPGTSVVSHAYDITPKPRKIGGPKALPSPVEDVINKLDSVERVEKNSVVAVSNPVSPLAVLNQTNPAKVRSAITAIEEGGDEAANALAGTSKADALLSQVAPKIVTTSGKIEARVVDPFRESPDPKLVEAVNAKGATEYTPGEIARAKAKFTKDFTTASGLSVFDGMGGFKLSQDGTKFEVSAVYGTSEGAFSNAREAVEQTKMALRNYGVLDNEIEVLAKQGMDYVPVKLSDVGDKEGSYLVRLKTVQDFDFNDIGKFSPVSIIRNTLDRFSALVPKNGASAAKYLLDPASMLHPVYTNAIGAATDRANYIDKLFIELTTAYSDAVAKMPKARRAAVEDFIKEANEKSIPFDRKDLTGRGFTDSEIDAIHSWKRVWDNHYYFENADIIQTLNRDGYQLFDNGNTRLFAKPVPQSTNVGKIATGINSTVGRVFDPKLNASVFVTPAETDMLYKAGGTYAKLRRPTAIGGESVTHMIVRNQPGEYMRKLRASDEVLNYKHMHYTRSYKAAQFVDEISATGRRAIAVGPDIPSVKSFVERMQKNNPDNKYEYRADDRGMLRGTDDWFDIESASGRVAQRHRGQILGTTDGTKILGDGSFVMDPANSAIRAAQSLAGRITMRPVLETAKARAIEQYGDLFPKDQFGRVMFPSTMDDIGTKGRFTDKQMADARTVVGHIMYLENGYGNAVDDFYKQVTHSLANAIGEKGFGKVERGVRAMEELAPTQKIKASVFQAYIVLSNPVRQLIIQSNGAVRTIALNPQHVLSGGVAKDLAQYVMDMGSATKSDFSKFVDESGIISGLDKSNLVRGTLSNIAEQRGMISNIGHKALVQYPRVAGFDLGEGLQQVVFMSAVYDSMKRQGLNMLDKTNRELAYGKVRALTGEMNRAGDMPYNQGGIAAITQFLQVPHKSFAMYTNRKLSGAEKARVAVGDMILWGSAGTTISTLFAGDLLPDDPDTRYMVTEGVQAYVYNNLFKSFFDEENDLDLASLNPYALDGWGKMFLAIKEGTFGDIIAAAPAYSLYNTENGRIPLAIKEMARYFSGDPEVDGLPPATLASIADRVGKITSGYSAYATAAAAVESGKWRDNQGNALPGEVSPALALARALGFGTLDTRQMYQLSQERFKTEKEFKETVLKDYRETYRILTNAMNKDKTERDVDIAATNVFMKRWKDDPAAWKIINQQMKKDFMAKDDQLLKAILRNSGIPDVGATRDQILKAPIPDDIKEVLLQRFNNDVVGK